MFPKSFTGWAILIIVVAVLLWGLGAAGPNLGSLGHSLLVSVRGFFTHLRSG